jgi:dihydrolipoamide dehydrogenase
MSGTYDAVVIGAGPGGEVAVTRLHELGLRVALVERELIGGECGYWACIPSKTLISPKEARAHAARSAGTVEPEQHWREVAAYRDTMIRHLDDSKQVQDYRDQGVDVYKTQGRIAGPRRVEVDGQVLESERIIVATGSESKSPPIVGLTDVGYWTSREATTVSELPEDVVILGGGPVGIELGQMLRRFGCGVAIVEAAEHALPREDPVVGELIGDVLRAERVELHTGVQATSASVEGGRRVVALEDGRRVSGRELIVAIGRAPRVGEIGLDSVGVELKNGALHVDERCRAADGVWVIGDATGVMPFTHVAKYQARIVCDDIAGKRARADYRAVPRVVFSAPEIAAVGLTEAQAREQGIDVTSARVRLPDVLARPWTYETEPRGELGLIADRPRQVLIGTWAVAPLASEWIHQAALAIKAELPLSVLRDLPAQFPTYSEGYLNAVEQLTR